MGFEFCLAHFYEGGLLRARASSLRAHGATDWVCLTHPLAQRRLLLVVASSTRLRDANAFTSARGQAQCGGQNLVRLSTRAAAQRAAATAGPLTVARGFLVAGSAVQPHRSRTAQRIARTRVLCSAAVTGPMCVGAVSRHLLRADWHGRRGGGLPNRAAKDMRKHMLAQLVWPNG